ncbi:penicillin-binding transpeptidase domain-containing protein [Flavihumibacter sp. CACIAM 22H1]|uniref:penicillin-binding transpeptidase domain-containing protein n=1 Tax=Flavihumibacter sp. CACIAM 22H1 TaxID=1812911 RepID=UPI0007A897EE|nr:penicillin-binding transpeptidase domain-containing protein [Flavihumibacter sp. CACIAM 22H1]KYP15679.1 MAG: hypothetical protein A1D16_19135 [Flavihumibacter sp. CACIAM 22H1]
MRYLLGWILISLGFIACSPNNVREDAELASLLTTEKLEGSIGIFHNLSGDFVLSDKKWFRDSAVNPGSSFYIIQSLIAIETGRLKDDSTVVGGTSLYQAFRGDSLAFFQNLAQAIGRDTLQKWLDTLGYARRYDTPRITQPDRFWLDNSMKITADEQLGIVKRLYFDQLPFQRRTHALVSELLLMEDSADHKIAYKLSETRNTDGTRVLWLQGWKEIRQHPHFFVIQLSSRDEEADLKAAAKRILDKVLAGFLP